MLKFTDEQMTLLEDEVYHTFLHGVVGHLDEYCAAAYAHLTPQEKFAVARQACDRAREHGFDEERGLILFASLSVMLGAGFDHDPALPWAANLLGDPVFLDSAERMDDLWGAAMTYLDDVFDEDEAPLPFDVYARYKAWIGSDRTPSDPVQIAAMLWPQKVEAIGRDALDTVLAATDSLAVDYGLRAEAPRERFSAMAFILGHRFDADPLYPWARRILADDTEDRGPDAVMDALEAACLAETIQPALEHGDNAEDQNGEG